MVGIRDGNVGFHLISEIAFFFEAVRQLLRTFVASYCDPIIDHNSSCFIQLYGPLITVNPD